MTSNHDDHAINVGPDGSRFEQLVATDHFVMSGDHHGGVCVEVDSSENFTGAVSSMSVRRQSSAGTTTAASMWSVS